MKYVIPIFVLAVAIVHSHSVAEEKPPAKKMTVDKLGETKNVHSFGDTLLCGQPSKEEFVVAKSRGVDVVITLRKAEETAWDEAEVVRDLGMEFHRFAFGAPPTLTDEIFDKTLKALADAKGKSVMLHCGSANRVGAIWLAHRVLNDGVDVEAARKEAKMVGLRTAGYEERALEYIKAKKE